MENSNNKPSLLEYIKNQQPDVEELLNQLPPDQKKILSDYINSITSDFEANILKPLEKSLEDISK